MPVCSTASKSHHLPFISPTIPNLSYPTNSSSASAASVYSPPPLASRLPLLLPPSPPLPSSLILNSFVAIQLICFSPSPSLTSTLPSPTTLSLLTSLARSHCISYHHYILNGVHLTLMDRLTPLRRRATVGFEFPVSSLSLPVATRLDLSIPRYPLL